MRLPVAWYRIFPTFLFLFFLISSFLYFFQFPKVIPATALLVTFFFEILAVWWSTQSYGLRHPIGKSFLYIFLGILFGTIGQIIWYTVHYFTNINLTGQTAPFYQLGYVLALIGFFLTFQAVKVHWQKSYVRILILTILVGLLLIFIAYRFRIFTSLEPNEPLIFQVITIGFASSDIALLVISTLILLLAVEYRGGLLGKSWFFIYLGQIVSLIANLLLGIYTIPYTSNGWPFSLLDYLWLTANLLVTYGFFNISKSLNSAQNEIRNSTHRSLKLNL